MSFDMNRVKGYRPSIEDILNDLEINSTGDIRLTILNKCRELSNNSQIKKFKNQDFIICDSTDFYKTFVNLGYGNSAMIIMDDYSPEKYPLKLKEIKKL